MESRPDVLHHLSALADGTRARILFVLGDHELTVTELCAALRLPQSTVSRHLKVLADGGWIHSRPEGTRRLYSLVADDLGSTARGLWSLTRDQLGATLPVRDDLQRVRAVVARRRERSQEFFASSAARWDRLRDELFGSQVHLHGLAALLPAHWTVADLGCGTGPVAAALAPWVRRVIGVDGSTAMLDAARARLVDLPNVELRAGELEALPLEDGEVDAATLILVLHHVPEPQRVLAEAARIVRPGGQLLVIDMLPHEQHDYALASGHVWLGFSPAQLERLLAAAGLAARTVRRLPVDPQARGPALFAARIGTASAQYPNTSSEERSPE
jgi:ArsR family transcriptional regulator